MARMNADEIAAAVARARWDGAREIETLVSSMTKLGLSLAAVAGALAEEVKAIGVVAVDAESKAVDSRAERPAPPTDPA